MHGSVFLNVSVHIPFPSLFVLYFFEYKLNYLYDIFLALLTAVKCFSMTILRVNYIESEDERIIVPMHVMVVLVIMYLMSMSIGKHFFLNTVLLSLNFIGNLILMIYLMNSHYKTPPSFKLSLCIVCLLILFPCLRLRYDNYRQEVSLFVQSVRQHPVVSLDQRVIELLPENIAIVGIPATEYFF